MDTLLFPSFAFVVAHTRIFALYQLSNTALLVYPVSPHLLFERKGGRKKI
jgi:hypothetical protein